jgi:hypothetical protein
MLVGMGLPEQRHFARFQLVFFLLVEAGFRVGDAGRGCRGQRGDRQDGRQH